VIHKAKAGEQALSICVKPVLAQRLEDKRFRA
jgi:hypothetical protein